MNRYLKEKFLILLYGLGFFISVSILSALFLIYIKKETDLRLMKEVSFYMDKIKHNENIKLPPYLKITFKKTPDSVFLAKQGKYLHIDKNHYYKPLYYFTALILSVIFALTIFHSYLLYKILSEIERKNKDINQLFETLILSISHKLGNILASQSVNIEMLKSNYSPKYISRIEQSYEIMKNDLKLILEFIKNSKFDTGISNVEISKYISEILGEYKGLFPNKNLNLRIKKANIKANSLDIKNLLLAVIENAFLYSQNKIFIKLQNYRNKMYLIIKNDINPASTLKEGSGIGLLIAESIAKKYDILLKRKLSKDKKYHILILKF